MANWSNPTITSNYITFVDEVKARDVDAITMQAQPVTSPPINSIRMDRPSPTSVIKFQEWNGTAFIDRILGPAGGGTGLTSLAGLGGAIGLGSMAYQNANTVAISGGSILSVSLGGNISYSGGSFTCSSTTGIPFTISAPVNQYGFYLGAGTTAMSYGALIRAGTGNASEIAFGVQNAAANLSAMFIYGNMGVHIQEGLRIPSGFNKWVP